jgi:hypothetical protein
MQSLSVHSAKPESLERRAEDDAVRDVERKTREGPYLSAGHESAEQLQIGVRSTGEPL